VCIARFKDKTAFDASGNLVSEVWQERVANLLDRTVALARKMKGP
jgi:hypothetical protein